MASIKMAGTGNKNQLEISVFSHMRNAINVRNVVIVNLLIRVLLCLSQQWLLLLAKESLTLLPVEENGQKSCILALMVEDKKHALGC